MQARMPTSSDDQSQASGNGHRHTFPSGEGASLGSRDPQRADDTRVLILTPVGRDAALITDLLRGHGVSAIPCDDVKQLCVEMHAGAGVAMVAEEALTTPARRCLLEELGRQPAWSELPLVVLTAPRSSNREDTRLAEALEPAANVTYLKRPVRPLTLASTVRTALRSRRRQYEVRDLLAAQAQAVLNSQAGLRQRDEFLAMLGHELRNPLATISSCLQVLELLGWDPEAVTEQRPVLARQTKHLARLVDDLLDVARITNGTITLKSAPLDLADLLRRCVTAMSLRYKEAGVTLTVAPQAESVMVNGDAVRLEQVINNLLVNAAKFTPAGGTVHASATIDGNDSGVVSIRDSGIGIPRDMLDRVFDLFAQAHAKIDRNAGGLGLGLTIVRRLIELHGGTVSVYSDGPNRGTEFTVRLPLLARIVDDANGDGRDKRQAGGRRVLLVEDNPDVQRIMGRLIRLWGHEVETADDGPGGFDKALAMHPDVVVLDIGLPGFDGYEVARRLRAAGFDETCLIAVTGYGQREDRERALGAGFNAHLVKPVDPDRLSKLIRRCSEESARVA